MSKIKALMIYYKPNIISLSGKKVNQYATLFVLLFVPLLSKGQDVDYPKLGVGTEISIVRGYTNLNTQYPNLAHSLSVVCKHSKYIMTELEVQKGKLSGGGLTVDIDRYGRQYTNNYYSVSLHTDVQLGYFTDHEWVKDNTARGWIKEGYSENNPYDIKHFYLGAGLGIIYNHNKVQRTNVIAQNGSLDYVFPGQDITKAPMLNIRMGYLFHIYDDRGETKYAVNLCFVDNVCLSKSGLDGYNDDSKKFKHNNFAMYTQFTIGFKYLF